MHSPGSMNWTAAPATTGNGAAARATHKPPSTPIRQLRKTLAPSVSPSRSCHPPAVAPPDAPLSPPAMEPSPEDPESETLT